MAPLQPYLLCVVTRALLHHRTSMAAISCLSWLWLCPPLQTEEAAPASTPQSRPPLPADCCAPPRRSSASLRFLATMMSIRFRSSRSRACTSAGVTCLREKERTGQVVVVLVGCALCKKKEEQLATCVPRRPRERINHGDAFRLHESHEFIAISMIYLGGTSLFHDTFP